LRRHLPRTPRRRESSLAYRNAGGDFAQREYEKALTVLAVEYAGWRLAWQVQDSNLRRRKPTTYSPTLAFAQSFTAVPHELWWDNEARIGRRRWFTNPVTALMGGAACPRRDNG
jgi:hypothetical protein